MVVGSLCPMVVGFTRAIVTDGAAAGVTAVAEPGITRTPGQEMSDNFIRAPAEESPRHKRMAARTAWPDLATPGRP